MYFKKIDLKMAVLSKSAKQTRLWMATKRPHMARTLQYTENLLGALDWIPGLESVKVINFASSALRCTLMKWHEKLIFYNAYFSLNSSNETNGC